MRRSGVIHSGWCTAAEVGAACVLGRQPVLIRGTRWYFSELQPIRTQLPIIPILPAPNASRAPRLGGTVAGAERQSPLTGLRPVAARDTSDARRREAIRPRIACRANRSSREAPGRSAPPMYDAQVATVLPVAGSGALRSFGPGTADGRDATAVRVVDLSARGGCVGGEAGAVRAVGSLRFSSWWPMWR